jgi:hypothetical protein
VIQPNDILEILPLPSDSTRNISLFAFLANSSKGLVVGQRFARIFPIYVLSLVVRNGIASVVTLQTPFSFANVVTISLHLCLVISFLMQSLEVAIINRLSRYVRPTEATGIK